MDCTSPMFKGLQMAQLAIDGIVDKVVADCKE